MASLRRGWRPRIKRIARQLARSWSDFATPLVIDLNYRLFKKRISRDQWADVPKSNNYSDLMTLSWEDTQVRFPDYFRRLDASVKQARGRVLELGAGFGTMTRWIARNPEVDSVVAVDGFADAIATMRAHALPKVTPMHSEVDALDLPDGTVFDTIMMCEFLEHLYPDEEEGLRQALRRWVSPETRFVISVPIGWLPDPHHVRAFSRDRFMRHLRRHYGEPESVDVTSGYSQVAAGRLTRRGEW